MLLRSYDWFPGFFGSAPLLVHVERKLVHFVHALVLGHDLHLHQPMDQSLKFAELLVTYLDSCLFCTGDTNVAYLCGHVVECVRCALCERVYITYFVKS